MMLNGTPINKLAIDGDTVNWNRLSLVNKADDVSVLDDGRTLVMEVIATANLSIFEELVSSIIGGGGGGGGIVVRVASDTVLLTDGVVYGLLRNRTLFEFVTVQDPTSNAILEHNAVVSETVDLTDQLLARRLRQIVTADGITLLDFLLSSTSSTRIVTQTTSDAILVGDQALVYRLRNRMQQDLATVTDQNLAYALRSRLQNDAAAVADQNLAYALRSRLPQDTAAVTDQAARSAIRARGPSDSALVGDGEAHQLLRNLAVLESVSFTDGQLTARKYDRNTGEFVVVYDEVARQLIFAALYKIKIMLGVGLDPVLSARDPAVISAWTPIALGAS